MLRMHALVHHTLRDFQSKQGRWSPSGRCTYDVRTEGEGGLPQKKTMVLISCVSVIVTRGRGGQNIRKFCGRHMYMPHPSPSLCAMIWSPLSALPSLLAFSTLCFPRSRPRRRSSFLSSATQISGKFHPVCNVNNTCTHGYNILTDLNLHTHDASNCG